MKKYSLFILTFFTVLSGFAQESFKNGMVVTAHPEASKVGIDILKKVEMQLMLQSLYSLLWRLFIQMRVILAAADF